MPKCYFCRREVGEEDYCHGCDEYVCEKCDRDAQVGEHEVEDHKG